MKHVDQALEQLEKTVTALWEGRDDLPSVMPEDEARRSTPGGGPP